MFFDKVSLAIIILLTAFAAEGIVAGLPPAQDTTATQDTFKYVSPFFEENEKCFMCHGQRFYQYTNQNLGRQMKAMMCQEMIISRAEFYQSNHRSFKCTDCHSDRFETFPHPADLVMEQEFTCLDCHGNDPQFAKYHFEQIDSQYHKSVHYKLAPEGFTCWECHNPHTYRTHTENISDIREVILYDNNICLHCHANYENFQLLTNRQAFNIIQEHSWLPNQSMHFMNVRCIECHTKISEEVPVAHEILPRQDAVQRCNDCHSRNSILMSTLYKFQTKETRKAGFFNGVILNQSYVIGANRNRYLNYLSLAIFLAVITVIGIHILVRIIKNKRQE